MNVFTKALLRTWLIAGTCDILAATLVSWIRSGTFPSKMLHYIAGGLLGLEESMAGGAGVAILGLITHYLIAFSWTLLFFLLFPRIKLLTANKYLAGFCYGIFVGMMMTFVVLPLTRLPDAPFVFQRAVTGWLVLAFAIGIPVALGAHRYYAPLDSPA